MVTGLAVSAAGGCSVIYDEYSPENDPVPENNTVLLALHVAPVVSTRANADSREAMHSLRVVLLDMDNSGKVEYNRLVKEIDVPEFAAGLSDINYANRVEVIPTTPGNKKIFLIANEESVASVKNMDGSLSDLLDSRPRGADGFESMIKDVYFTPDFSKNLVLSSSYMFSVRDNETRHEENFFLVHAAAKFEFSFENLLPSDLQIDELTVSSIAEDMFLMAHFDNNQISEEKNVEWVDALGKPRKEYWIDWLKEVSDVTTANPKDTGDPGTDNETINATYGWIRDYYVPMPAAHQPISMLPDGSTEIIPVSTAVNPVKTLPVVYCPESKNITDGDNVKQKYSFSLKMTNLDPNVAGNDKVREFRDIALTDYSDGTGSSVENLQTLFRNTHVKVAVTISKPGEEIELTLLIGICPWVEEEITIPTFD